ncbi:L,D-transpeptidase family protein [Flavitalea flava]
MIFHDKNPLFIFLLLVFCQLTCQSCQDHTHQQKTAPVTLDTLTGRKSIQDPSIPGGFSAQKTLYFDSSQLLLFIKKYPLFASRQKDILQFYSSRNFAYAWYDNKGLIEQAGNLYNRVMNLSDEGVSGKFPYKDSLNQIFNESSASSRENPQTELMLTAGYFTYAYLAWGGLNERQTQSINWYLPRKKLNLPGLMDSLLKDSSSALLLKGYVYRQYGLLKNYLQRYRELEARNNWPIIKTDRKSYKAGDSSHTILAIRERLQLLGDLAENSGSPLLEQELETGLKNYQRRLGMKEDGVIGPGTLQELNRPLSSSIRQLIVNMERCRWVPASLDKEYFIVNIPAFELFVYDGDSLLFTMKAVVGKAVHKTVIFNGNLQYVVFSPYWNVPSGILKNEVLPGIRRDPGYLKKHNMEWVGNSVRQRPGPANPLGQVKFLLPNSYDIYLHDTPAKTLFSENDRAFSHGCIRLANARKIAHYLLRDDPKWPDGKIDSAMQKGKEQWVTLKKPVPVFIAYFTAWVDRAGKLNVRKDLYKRDDRLAAMLMDNAGQGVKY